MSRFILGWICIGIGVLGIALPLIPGLLFLVAGLLMLKSKSVFVRWVYYWCQARSPKFKHLALKAQQIMKSWEK